ncbi:MAG: type II toxin-antitoxin system HicB family antitoxin [Deltaproteobacteria bacterium]|nr:type II toxin-antitoxin system HicB family antitoxin [Deltaproteobacteria bacterium]
MRSEKRRFVYYQEGELWVGWLEEFPDYRSQGTTLDELKDNLREIYQDLTSGQIPLVRHVGEIAVG